MIVSFTVCLVINKFCELETDNFFSKISGRNKNPRRVKIKRNKKAAKGGKLVNTNRSKIARWKWMKKENLSHDYTAWKQKRTFMSRSIKQQWNHKKYIFCEKKSLLQSFAAAAWTLSFLCAWIQANDYYWERLVDFWARNCCGSWSMRDFLTFWNFLCKKRSQKLHIFGT